MHMIFFAGLRGSVAFALAYLFPDDYGHRNIIMCSTTVVILVTIFIQGGLTEEAIRALGIPTNIDMGQYLKVLLTYTVPAPPDIR
jgi:NhaP-type Na+/H+ or K+/H+ antiporter